MAGPKDIKILIINPNSSSSMTHGIDQAISEIDLSPNTHITTYTGPKDSPASINDAADIATSTTAVTRALAADNTLAGFDAVLIACFSVHPLVRSVAAPQRLATGIFEAALLASLALLPDPAAGAQWGIVTTGKFWEQHLADGVAAFLGTRPGAESKRFAGVESTGLNAGDFHGGVDPEEVRRRLREATARLLDRGEVTCVVMGCAGMAGLDDIIRSVALEKYGDKGRDVYIVDGITAGVGLLEQMVRNKRTFQGSKEK